MPSTQLAKSTNPKAKELKYEEIDDNTYDLQANIVGFKVPLLKIAPYIKGLSIMYYEITK